MGGFDRGNVQEFVAGALWVLQHRGDGLAQMLLVGQGEALVTTVPDGGCFGCDVESKESISKALAEQ